MWSTQVVQTIVGQVGFTDVTDVTVIQSLWANYGKLYRCQAARRRDDETATQLVVKHFAPPLSASDDSEDHLRKMRSYEVESAFYEKLSAKMIDRGCIVPELVGCTREGQSIALVMRDLGAQYGSFTVRRGNCMDMDEAKQLLRYLARFHGINWGQSVEGLWPEGSFWQLGTRMDELQYLDTSWKRYGLDRDMALRIHELVTSLPHRTIVHGDAKAANFFWFDERGDVGGYDLQYVGGASPMRDIAYTLGCSLQEHLIERHEEALLRFYHGELLSHLSPKDAAGFTFETMQDAYDLCVADLVRFMCGSRWWGNTDYLEMKAKSWLKAHAV